MGCALFYYQNKIFLNAIKIVVSNAFTPTSSSLNVKIGWNNVPVIASASRLRL